jgi:hypothetical protein
MIYYNNNINIELPYYSFYGFFIHKDDYINLLNFCEQTFKIFLINANNIIYYKLKIILNPPYLTYAKYSKTNIAPNTLQILGKEVEFNIYKIVYNTEPNFQFIVGLVKLKKNWTCNPIPHIVLAKNPAIDNNIILNLLLKNSNYLFDVNYNGPQINAKLGLCSFNSETHLYQEQESPLPLRQEESPLRQQQQQQREDSPQTREQEDTNEDLITINLLPNNPSEKEIFTGRNGGKYRIINGKKYYINNKQKQKANYVIQ